MGKTLSMLNLKPPQVALLRRVSTNGSTRLQSKTCCYGNRRPLRAIH